ncbi:hypothetical protein NQ318_011942 [Aromia moschata]|uniref:Transposase n=1 Tax=Aromia moschata TaxID=1265417 RepID=A0AAV8XK09_9CUCU|nr:hypothetical protein NQ318_011942 [Aromia moschata]
MKALRSPRLLIKYSENGTNTRVEKLVSSSDEENKGNSTFLVMIILLLVLNSDLCLPAHVRDLPKSGRPPVPENTQLDVMLQVQDNPHSRTRQMGIDFNLSHTSVRNILHKQKFHPYKITLMQEL